MMETQAFKGCLETLAIYAEVRFHLTSTTTQKETLDKLDDLIAGLITHLHINAKGQIT